MIILGIASEHNSSAALMIDGRVVGLIQEERFTKRKNQVAFPLQAARRLIDIHLGGKASRIDRVAYAGLESDPYYAALDKYSAVTVADHVREMHELWYPHFYGGKLNDGEYWRDRWRRGAQLNHDHNFDFSFLERLPAAEVTTYFSVQERADAVRRHLDADLPVHFLRHHDCHAHYAYFGQELPQLYRDALVLTADAWGDGENWTAWTAEAERLKRLAGGPEQRIARLYKFVTLILGMKPNEHEYKVMGLSAYSRYDRAIRECEQIFFEMQDFRAGAWVADRPLRDHYFDVKDRLEGQRFDVVAAALQNWATAVTVGWARHWLAVTGCRSLCFSGGLSMNIKSNGDLLRLLDIDHLSVPASGGDESLSAGACFALSVQENQLPSRLAHVYLGTTPEQEADWTGRLGEAGAGAEDFVVLEDVGAEDAARLLAADIVVARCVGPAEFGARSLGNRSILANPSNAGNVKLINDAIKNRDFWMPFTPSIQEEHVDEYVVNPKGVKSPFMTIGFDTKPDGRDRIPATVHAGDFSVRPQFVSRSTNPDYWDLIEAFRKLTGVAVLLNTSLNLHGEPMNYSLADAARTVAKSELDFLLMPGRRLLCKKRALVRARSVLGRGV